ncbi:MAG: thiamine phosphate synthase [Bacteroidales bacterium]
MEPPVTDDRAALRPAMLCLVTPGVRPVAASQSGSVPSISQIDEGQRWLLDLVQAAIDAGIDVVQLREPQLPARQLYELAVEAVRRSRGTATRIVVNDRVDVALAARADGVHLGRPSLSPARVREIAQRPCLVGCSVHSLEELRNIPPAEVDYLVAGTVYPTASKPAATTLLGVDGFASLADATSLPVLAIGGVTLDRIPELAAAGAAGVAAIGLFADADRKTLPCIVGEAKRALTRFTQFPKLRRTHDDA